MILNISYLTYLLFVRVLVNYVIYLIQCCKLYDHFIVYNEAVGKILKKVRERWEGPTGQSEKGTYTTNLYYFAVLYPGSGKLEHPVSSVLFAGIFK